MIVKPLKKIRQNREGNRKQRIDVKNHRKMSHVWKSTYGSVYRLHYLQNILALRY